VKPAHTDKERPFPRFLLIDTPETAGIDRGNLSHAIPEVLKAAPIPAQRKPDEVARLKTRHAEPVSQHDELVGEGHEFVGHVRARAQAGVGPSAGASSCSQARESRVVDDGPTSFQTG